MTTASPAVTTGHPTSAVGAVLDALGRFPMSVLLLLIRVGVGMVFFKAGLLKYNSWEFTVLLFRDEYQVPLLAPELAARMAMVQELTLPVLLFLGLGARLATLPLFGMLLVIQTFVYPNAWADHLFWGGALALILTRGPGALSLDHLIARRVSRRTM
ncbi:MAG: DoxX family protein [Vicinamibacterales bacterium]